MKIDALKALKKYLDKAEYKGEEVREQIHSDFEDKFSKTKNKKKLDEVRSKLWSTWLLYKDSKAPSEIKIWAAAALLYFIVPTDLIADFLPFIGYADDLVVISMVLKKIANYLASYEKE